MATLNETNRLLRRIILTNMVNGKHGLYITPFLNGEHGIGKTTIISNVSHLLNGASAAVDGSLLNEGEIGGIPFPRSSNRQNQVIVLTPSADGKKMVEKDHSSDNDEDEVIYIPHYVFKNIRLIEKKYYEIASGNGFLDGTVKIETKENGNKYLISPDQAEISLNNDISDILEGDSNKYKFGDELSSDIKMKLLASGEIKPVIIFLDELNRADNTVFKELMNIILAKSANGYNLPWWVSIIAAGNPSGGEYATNEMDPAQKDRFLFINVRPNMDEVLNYFIDQGYNLDFINAIAMNSDVFSSVSPRSWEMALRIFDYTKYTNNSSFFSGDELSPEKLSDDIRVLIRSKIGETPARTIFTTLANKDKNIKPEEIITGESLQINPKISERLKSFQRISQNIIAKSLISYLEKLVPEVTKLEKSSKAEDNSKYMNIISQIREFINILDTSSQILFVKNLMKRDFDTKQQSKLFRTYAKRAISKDILNNLTEANAVIDQANKE